jgi:outer membrane receptor protein involved in Fe transport
MNAVAIMLVVLGGTAPFAQETAPRARAEEGASASEPRPRTAEAVTVTATRVETELDEAPGSVLVLSRRRLERTAALTIDDALRSVPGFSLFRRSGSRTAHPTAQGVSLRGIGSSGASRALVLADGVPLNDPFGGWVYWGRVPRAALERVEVLRGGASDLYGNAALGGVVHLFRRRPERPLLALDASYGGQGTHEASVLAALGDARFSAELAAESFGTDGYVPVDVAERGAVDVPANSSHRTASLTLRHRPASGPTLFARGSYFDEARSNGTPLQQNETWIAEGTAGADWQLTAGVLSLRAYHSRQRFDAGFSAVSADRASESLTRQQSVPARATGLGAQWAGALGTRHALAAGIEGRDVRGSSDESIHSGPLPTESSAGGRQASAAVFVEDLVRVTERLSVLAGVRLDLWQNRDGLSVTRPPAGPERTTRFEDRSETALSPRAAALWRLTRRLSLSAAAYRAFRAPTLNELYRPFRVGNVVTLASSELQAERLSGAEAGVRLGTGDGRLSVHGTLFWMQLDGAVGNVTLSATPELITRQRQNLGGTRSRGVELDASARLGRRLALAGGYLYADALVTDNPEAPELIGLWLPQVPRHQASVRLDWEAPADAALGLQARWAGAQFDDDRNQFRLGGFWTLDLYASRPLAGGAEAFVAAENLLDARHDVGRTPVRTLGPPRFIRAGLRLRLGGGP